MTIRPVRTIHGSYDSIVREFCNQIASQRESRSLDAWLAAPVTVVVPSHGLARSLVSSLLERYPEGVAGIHLLRPEELAASIVASPEPLRLATAAEQRLAMEGAVAAASARHLRGASIVDLLLRTHRDLRDSGQSAAEVHRRISSRRSADRLAAETAEVFVHYQRRLEAMGVIETADLLERAAADIPKGDLGKIEIFGFYDATGAQLELLRALARHGRVSSIWIPVPSRNGEIPQEWQFARSFSLSFRSSQRAEVIELDEPRVPDSWSIRRFPGPIDEASGAAARAKELLDSGVDFDRIAIVARAIDRRRADRLARAARLHGVPLADRNRRPSRSSRLGRALLLLLSLERGNLSRSSVVELLHLGYRPDGVDAAPRAIDQETRRLQLSGIDTRRTAAEVAALERRGETGGRELESFMTALRAIEELTGSWAAGLRGSEWAALIDEIVRRLDPSTATDFHVAASIDEVTATLRRKPSSGSLLQASAIRDLIASLDDLPGEKQEGIALVDMMQLRGRRFDHLIVVGMTRSELPQDRSEDVLFPDDMRRSLGIREIGDGRDEEELLFRVTIASAAQSIDFFWASRDDAGDETLASPLLKQFVLEQTTESEHDAILRNFDAWVDARRLAPSAPPQVETSTEAVAIFRRRDEMLAALRRHSVWDGYVMADDVAPGMEARLSEISATDIQKYGQCPHSFLLTKILRVRDLDETGVDLEIASREKGQIDHAILERFYSTVDVNDLLEAERSDLLPDRLASHLASIIDDAFTALERDAPAIVPQLRDMQRKLTHGVLTSFIAGDVRELHEQGLVPRHFEYSFGTVGRDETMIRPAVEIPIGSLKLRLRGTIDRIDVSHDGERIRIVDYKSGRGSHFSNIASSIAEGHMLQLPLYALAAARLFDRETTLVSAMIKPLADPEAKQDRFGFNLGEIEETLRVVLETLATSIEARRFPTVQGKWCDWCTVAAGCRSRFDEVTSRRQGKRPALSILLEEAETP